MRVPARSGFASEASFRGIQCWIGFYPLCRSVAGINHLVRSFDSRRRPKPSGLPRAGACPEGRFLG